MAYALLVLRNTIRIKQDALECSTRRGSAGAFIARINGQITLLNNACVQIEQAFDIQSPNLPNNRGKHMVEKAKTKRAQATCGHPRGNNLDTMPGWACPDCGLTRPPF